MLQLSRASAVRECELLILDAVRRLKSNDKSALDISMIARGRENEMLGADGRL